MEHAGNEVMMSQLSYLMSSVGYKEFLWPPELNRTIAAKIDGVFYHPKLVPKTWPLYNYINYGTKLNFTIIKNSKIFID